MYVRKFEADTLEEALKSIKRELGPDAIVLKTVTNKGLKGAFKKKRIEITAAISEKNYTDKAKVDSVLSDDQREKFYQSSSTHVSQQIKGYNQQPNQAAGAPGYGNVGLNRQVKSTKKTPSIDSSLDNFLKPPVVEAPKVEAEPQEPLFQGSFDDFMSKEENNIENNIQAAPAQNIIRAEVTPKQEAPIAAAVQATPVQEYKAPLASAKAGEYEEVISIQNEKIQFLESKIQELIGMVEVQQMNAPVANSMLKELRNKLRALGICEEYIQFVIKKVSFDFDGNEEEDFNEILDLTLNEMMSSLTTTMPLFSKSDEENKPTITLFVSDSTCGQTSMAQKISSLCPDSQIVYIGDGEKNKFIDQMLGLNVKRVANASEIVTTCRQNMANGINTFVDYRSINENDNFKKFVKGLKRSFDKVEVFTTISAIHTETYNESVLNKYQDVSDGVVVNFIDHCLDYGMLFNINQKFQESPFVFYGNGDTVPDDVEAATAERILAGMFRIG